MGSTWDTCYFGILYLQTLHIRIKYDDAYITYIRLDIMRRLSKLYCYMNFIYVMLFKLRGISLIAKKKKMNGGGPNLKLVSKTRT